MFDGAWIHFTGETAEWLSTRTAGSNKTGEVALTYRNGGSFQTILCTEKVHEGSRGQPKENPGLVKAIYSAEIRPYNETE